MNRSIPAALALLTVVTVFAVSLPKEVRAVSPPTMDCEQDFVPDNVATYNDFFINPPQGLVVNRAGNAFLAYYGTHKTGGGQDAFIAAVNNQCSTLWKSPCISSGAASCNRLDLRADPAGQIGTLSLTQNSLGQTIANQFIHISATSGNLLAGSQPVSVNGLGGSCTTYFNGEGSGYYDSASAQIRYAYVESCGTSNPGSYMIVNDLGSTAPTFGRVTGDSNVPIVNGPQTIVVPGESSTFAYVLTATGPSSDALVKLTLSTGATLATHGLSSNNAGGATRQGPAIGNPSSGIYALTSSTTRSYGWDHVSVGTWASLDTGSFGAGGNNNLPDSSSVAGWAVGGDNNFLLCGEDNVSPFKSILIKANTDVTHAIDWSVQYEPAGLTGASSCGEVAFDYGTGFYTVGTYVPTSGPANGRQAFYIQHWSGGGFTQPSPGVDHTAVYPNPDGGGSSVGSSATAGVVDVGSGIKAWAQSVGFVSGGSLFFFGLILLAFGMIAVGAAVGTFAGKMAGGVGAGITAIGVAIFNMLNAIWDIWTMAVLVVLTAAILSVIVRKLYQPGIESGGS